MVLGDQLFFEPRSKKSREAARRSVDRIAQRTKDRSVPVPVDWAAADLGDKPRNPLFPADAVLEALKTTSIPILHISGDHDIIFPVENWYALNQQLPTVQLLTCGACRLWKRSIGRRPTRRFSCYTFTIALS